jgi:hypothetical protein
LLKYTNAAYLILLKNAMAYSDSFKEYPLS